MQPRRRESGAMWFSRLSLSLLDDRETDRPDSPDAWLGRVHEDDRADLLAAFVTALGTANGPVVCEHRIVRRDGSERSLSARLLFEYSESGHAVRLIGRLCDLTSYRLIEAETRHAFVLADVGRLAVASAHDFNNLAAPGQPMATR